MKSIKPLFIVLSALLGCSLAADAQTLGIQFWASTQPANTAPLTPGEIAGVVPQDNFNVLDLASPVVNNATVFSPLVSSTGAPTTATLTLGNNNDAYFTGTSTSTPNGTLLSSQSGSYSNSSPVTYTFNGLQAGTYDLYIYTVTNVTGDVAQFNLANGATSGPTSLFDLEQNGTAFDGTFIQSTATTRGAATTANYVEFTGVTPNSGTIEVSLPNQGFLFVDAINGFQLVEVPEPSTVFLFAAGALMLLSAGWKYRPSARC